MAPAVALFIESQRLKQKPERKFRDRQNPLEIFNPQEVYSKFRFRPHQIVELCSFVEDKVNFAAERKGSLSTILMVCLTLRFYASGSFVDMIGELIGVSKSTSWRAIQRVTNIFFDEAQFYMPSQVQANRTSLYNFEKYGIPQTIAFVDGTHVRIQAPVHNQDDYINRKLYHSINVQVRDHNL